MDKVHSFESQSGRGGRAFLPRPRKRRDDRDGRGLRTKKKWICWVTLWGKKKCRCTGYCRRRRGREGEGFLNKLIWTEPILKKEKRGRAPSYSKGGGWFLRRAAPGIRPEGKKGGGGKKNERKGETDRPSGGPLLRGAGKRGKGRGMAKFLGATGHLFIQERKKNPRSPFFSRRGGGKKKKQAAAPRGNAVVCPLPTRKEKKKRP